MSEVKKFKTESKRLLDLMTNSIYTNKEIFLRELISNASDACDKYHYLALKEKKYPRDDHEILIEVNKTSRTIVIKDNGIGMTHDELINHLGTIASSGSSEFMKNLEDSKKSKIDIIGQFGVGFYSSFMVASKVLVETRSLDDESGYSFTSSGEETFEINKINKDDHGTVITLYIRNNDDNNNYDTYLEQYTVQSLIKKYSDYVHYPIKMMVSKNEAVLDDSGNPTGQYETKNELETLNSMVPLWKRNKKDVTEEMLNDFYKGMFYDYQNPEVSLNISTEGMITYNALIFIPSTIPYDLYQDSFKKGLKLYTKGVFIMDKCEKLVPDYLRFIRGLVDSSDLSLNISREILQEDKQLEKIGASLEKKILGELTKIKENDFEKYQRIFKNFGINLKYGVYEGYGVNKDKLKDLLIYNSLNEEKMISLKDYIDHMKDGQKYIYYVSASSKEQVMSMPQMDMIKSKGYDVLVLSENVDEFAINVLKDYNGKEFKSINQGDLDVDDVKKEEINKLSEDKKEIIGKIKEILADDVADVKLSTRLSDSPVCLVSGDGISFEMEKVLANNPANNNTYKASKILEINPEHEIFKTMEKLYLDSDFETLNNYASLLLDQALLMEGFEIKDPAKFSKLMCDIMVKNKK